MGKDGSITMHIKFINDNYINPYSVSNLIYYILNPCKVLSFCYGGIGVSLTCQEEIVRQFIDVKKAYGKRDGRQLRHIVISFYSKEVSAEQIFSIAYDICNYYGKRYQTVFAVHKNTLKLHMHIVVNTVSYVDGLKYSEGKNAYYDFLNHVKEVIKNSPYQRILY